MPSRPASPYLRPKRGTALVEIAGLTRVFAGESPVTALAGIDLLIRAGEFVAITGRSGSGKSTLMNVIGLLEPFDDGQYHLSGSDVGSLGMRARDALRASLFGFVFQSFHLIDYFTASENVEVGLTYSADRARRRNNVPAVLERVGLAHRGAELTKKLSGGERQRVAIARALIDEPAVLLADEPTGNLDEENSRAVLDLFTQIHHEGVTVVVVTHDELTASHAQRRLVISDGKVASDTSGELLPTAPTER